MKENITTVIFDMYETLARNDAGLWVHTFQRICLAQNLSIDPEELWRQWKKLEVGFRRDRLNLDDPWNSPPFKSYEEAWRECFSGVYKRLGLSGDPEAAARMSVEALGMREFYPDAVETLPKIQERWRTGLLSNADNDYLNPTLACLAMRFDAVLSSETARAYKPHPGPFMQVMDLLGVGAQDCVYVGDNQFDDVLGAQRVGMKAVWVNRKGALADPRYPLPEYQVKDLKELPQILEQMEN
jgi:2-haloalkanoic acid dehalogenase type II